MAADSWAVAHMATTRRSDATQQANALVMAAAPAMLAALEQALPHISQEVEDRKHGGNDEAWQDLEAVEAAIIAAVAEAKGA